MNKCENCGAEMDAFNWGSCLACGHTIKTPMCKLCGKPMPEGEEMFHYHGYSGRCSTIPLDLATDLQIELLKFKGIIIVI